MVYGRHSGEAETQGTRPISASLPFLSEPLLVGASLNFAQNYLQSSAMPSTLAEAEV